MSTLRSSSTTASFYCLTSFCRFQHIGPAHRALSASPSSLAGRLSRLLAKQIIQLIKWLGARFRGVHRFIRLKRSRSLTISAWLQYLCLSGASWRGVSILRLPVIAPHLEENLVGNRILRTGAFPGNWSEVIFLTGDMERFRLGGFLGRKPNLSSTFGI